MHSPALLDHFQNPRNVGELEPPAATVEVSNPACGDILRLSVLWRGDRVERCAFKVRGCTASIAAGSALTELVLHKTRAELQKLNAADVEAAIGGLGDTTRHAATLAMDGVKALLRTG